MLMTPAHSTLDGVTIFADDELFFKFYLLAAAPRIRLDNDGHPIFLLTKYAISDEDRLLNKAAPAGGGYVNFDIEFDVPTEHIEAIRPKLQRIVNDQWNRLKAGSAADQAQKGVAGA